MNSVGEGKKLVDDSDICKPGVCGMDPGFMQPVIIFLRQVFLLFMSRILFPVPIKSCPFKTQLQCQPFGKPSEITIA